MAETTCTKITKNSRQISDSVLYYRQKKPENMAVRTEEDKGGFFMNLKTVRILLFTLLALTLASFLIGCGVSKPVYFLFTALFAVGYAVVWLLCWRCPFCGGRLGRSDGESCPHCGKSLLAPRGHQAG